MFERPDTAERSGTAWRALACALALGACSTGSGANTKVEPDWSGEIAVLILPIDSCLAAAPEFRVSPGNTVSIARRNADGTTTVRLGASSIEDIEDSGKVHVVHHYWECLVAADGQKVATFNDLESGTPRLPGEAHPSFMRADARWLCPEGKCFDKNVFAPDGKLLGYLIYRKDPLPDSLKKN
jgi:hypothetical protein